MTDDAAQPLAKARQIRTARDVDGMLPVELVGLIGRLAEALEAAEEQLAATFEQVDAARAETNAAQAREARFAQSLEVARSYAEEIERAVPPGDGQGCAQNIQQLVGDTLAGKLPTTLEHLNAAERGRTEWYRNWDAARADAAAQRAVIERAVAILEGCRSFCPHMQPDMSGIPGFMLGADRCGTCAMHKALYALKDPEDFHKTLNAAMLRAASQPATAEGEQS